MHWCICISEHKVPKYPTYFGIKFGKKSKLELKIHGVWAKVSTMKVVPTNPIYLQEFL
jgi:hypothetical protein